MAIDTSKSAADYATALQHLLPPGEYFSGDDVDKITLAQAEELARIHGKVDADFDISNVYLNSTDQEELGWKLEDYRALLTNAGMVDFEVSDHYRLPMVAGLKCGKPLGDVANVSLICIHFQVSQQALFDDLIPILTKHKLSHTRILAVGLPAETSNLLV
jgi:hypothetical protein